MKSLEEYIAEHRNIVEAKEDTVFAVVDENGIIMNIFNTEEEADKEIENLKDNPVPVKKEKMKRSEIESKE